MKPCSFKTSGTKRMFVLLAVLIHSMEVRAEDHLISDFSGSSYGNWTATGTAFQKGPASGELLAKLEITNASATFVGSSEIEGDVPTGTLTSSPFSIERKYIAFRIAGGDYEYDTCIHLLIDDKVVRSATGWRSDRLVPTSWDVSEFRGRSARIQLVDKASGDWGHINVDKIVQTDSPERPPVVTGPLYSESLRPQFHFTARQWAMNRLNPGMLQEGWINDLNGLIFYKGEYHLFVQRWAKCWVHAVSRDLIHWTELEPAFWEESTGSGVQSGTCVIDYENTSGLSPDKLNPPMVAFWSRFDNRSQCLSYSLDQGRTWKPYDKNPYMVFPERDPKVFWYAPGKHWVLMMYGDGKYHIFTSANLLEWKNENHPIADSFECPDFFELPVDGDVNRKRWVLIQGNGKYSIGRFNGKEFNEETDRRNCDIGDFYATQSWHNMETGDGRRIQTAWLRFSEFPDMPFNQQITFPCELTLHNSPKGLRIHRQPIREIESLHQGCDLWEDKTLRPGEMLPLEPSGRLFHVKAKLVIPENAKCTFIFRGVPVVLTSNSVESGSQKASVDDKIESVEFLLDVASIETFVNHGEISSTRFVLPRENGLSVRGDGGDVVIRSLAVYPLKSAWAEAESPKPAATQKSN